MLPSDDYRAFEPAGEIKYSSKVFDFDAVSDALPKPRNVEQHDKKWRTPQ
jgi:hypothetical protein